MDSKQQTAVNWLFKQLWDTPKDKLDWYAILAQAKQMEKEQIVNSFTKGFSEGTVFGTVITYKYQTSEQYYNETYESTGDHKAL